MTPDDVAFFKRYAAKILEEAHPCDAARALDTALGIITDLANERDELRKKLGQKLFQALTGDLLKRPSAAKKKARLARVWFDSPNEHSLVDLFKVRDHEGDCWAPEDKANPEGKWLMVNYKDEPSGPSHSSFISLLKEWRPLVEVGEGLEQVAWFSEDGNADDYYPDKVSFVTTGDQTLIWTRVYGNLWRASNQTDEDVKSDGYWPFAEIINEHDVIYRVETGPPYSILKWQKGEGEPHDSIKWVMTSYRFYWEHHPEGYWYCPDGGHHHAEEVFGKQRVTWEELLEKHGTLTEFFK